ncbi:hypothetical protein AB3G33_13825 [Flavobacterium sp. WC2421]|uniref:hypothetical protein n=1 Tax=Flavobacterium sp. WC2421 TaxID=3234138 RepID=UPI003467CDF4
MKKLNETDLLDQTILALKTKKADEFESLKEQFHCTYESIKLMNLIKNAFTDLTDSPVIKNSILNNVIGLSTGYLSRKLILGSSQNPIKRVLGSVFQFVVSNFVSKHSSL